MGARVSWAWAAAIFPAVLMVACVSDEGPDAATVDARTQEQQRCEREVSGMVAAVEAFVDGLAGIGPLEYATEADLQGDIELQTALETHQQRLGQLDCHPDQTRRHLAGELGRVEGDGAIAEAVALSLRVSLLGGRTDQPRTIEITPEDDLAAAAVTAPPGSTLRLTEGEHHVDEPVLVAYRLSIVGAGPERTRITSAAEETALLALEQADLELADLRVTHTAETSSAVVVVLTEAYRLRDLTISGATASPDEEGGVGLLIDSTPPTGERQDAAPGPRSGTIDHVTITDNEGPGLAVAGSSSPRIVDLTVRDNGLCGVCFTGTVGGSLADSEVSGNAIGVAVSGAATPHVSGTHVLSNATDGLLFEGDGGGRFVDNDISDNGERGVTATGSVSARLHRNRIEGNDQLGVALLGDAALELTSNEILDHEIGVWAEAATSFSATGNRISADGVGVVITGSSRATMVDNHVIGAEVGIDVREESQVDLADNIVGEGGEVGIVLRDESAATGEGNRCEDVPVGVWLLDAATSSLTGGNCEEFEGLTNVP